MSKVLVVPSVLTWWRVMGGSRPVGSHAASAQAARSRAVRNGRVLVGDGTESFAAMVSMYAWTVQSKLLTLIA